MKRSLLLTAALALTLTGCASTDQNDADVTFAQQMVPHHEQAVEMADMALDPARGASSEVRDLATRIKKAQGPEIREMKDWLDDWDADESMEGMDHGDHGDHGSMEGMEGMMSDSAMSALGRAKGTSFDRQWLQMMIEHHEGAVTMSRTEIADGKDADAKELARDITSTQKKEIAEMKELLR